ncbi:hypothetical protein HYFRA_00013792 [Hymenoscyphus fraxineus]|uniref:Uncharacterized protein n=1 Tax=Hymenoscyphus fraxineus TaxID=746836 RepID=A0A9N9L6Y8_9HELO|nr:hypothetical protein HYFRA_00013792 [Hymenoscyphus fraxineus]
MKFAVVMLGIFAATVMAQAQEPFCDNGTEGDGGCEANGQHTYCCIQDESDRGAYHTRRKISVLSANKAGSSQCTAPNAKVQGGGKIACAP